MFKPFTQTLQKKLIGFLIISILSTTLAPTHRVGAIPVTEVGPNVVQNTVNAGANTLTAGFAAALNLKELTLDGIAYALTRKIIQAMVRSIINWINSGFQGSPAFVTDLGGFLRDVADEIVGDVLYNSDLAFLCSPFQLDVRIAIATEFANGSAAAPPQCTLTGATENIENFLQGSFSNGGWANWFELTQGRSNDPNKAYLDASIQTHARIINAQGQTVKEFDWGNGFMSFKVCSDSQEQSGAQKNCKITTPGRVISDQLNKALGAGQDSLITADEINEIIGALLAQLAQQALTGIGGLLGLSENRGGYTYTANDGSEVTIEGSYLDALAEENPNPDLATNAIGESLAYTLQYIQIQVGFIERIDEVEADYEDRVAVLGGLCAPPDFPDELNDIRDTANTKRIAQSALAPVLEELDERFGAASSPEEQDAIFQSYLELAAQNLLVNEIDISLDRVQTEFEIDEIVDELDSDLRRSEAICNR